MLPRFYSVSPTRNNSRDSSISKLSQTPLKSSIPVPTPVDRKDARIRSASASNKQPTVSKIPPAFERHKTSLSLYPQNETTSLRKPAVCSKTVPSTRNPYANVKSKIDNTRPHSTSIRNQFSSKLPIKNSNETDSNSNKNSDFESISAEPYCEVKSQNADFKTESETKSTKTAFKSDNNSHRLRSTIPPYSEAKPQRGLPRSVDAKYPRTPCKTDNETQSPRFGSPQRTVNESFDAESPRTPCKPDNETESPRSGDRSPRRVVESFVGESPRTPQSKSKSPPRATARSPRSVFEAKTLRLTKESNSPRPSLNSEKESLSPRSAVESNQRTDEITEKQQQLLTIYQELKKLKPLQGMHHLEGEICSLMEKKTLDHLEGLSKPENFAQGCTPEFVSTFEKQMQHVTKSWLQLINDIVISKNTVGKTALPHMSMSGSSWGLQDEIAWFLTNITVEGESLDEKLHKVEEEQLRVMTVVMYNIIALAKQYGDLKDENTRLRKTQDQINLQQNEQLAILGQENKDLSRRYTTAVEMCNVEKSKAEQMERSLDAIHREMLEIRKILKCNERKCNEIDLKTKKADGGKRALENTLRILELSMEKKGKQHRELSEKYNNSEETINKLKYELEQRRCANLSLEETNKDLQVELQNMKTSLEENEQKRQDLVEEIANKSKKLNELKEQLESAGYSCMDGTQKEAMNQDYASNLIVKDLTRNMQDKNNQVNELKKKQHELENQLKEMATTERMLTKQIHELKKNRTEHDVSLESQVRVLQYRVIDLEREKSELERMVTQQTLELDQRDLMLREHAELLRARDQLIPMMREKKNSDKQCSEKLMAIVYEKYKSHFTEGYSDGMLGDQSPYKSLEALEQFYGLDPKMVEKEMSFRQEKMTEMINLLERKQMEINKLERRIRAIEGDHPSLNMKEQAQRNNKWGFLSMFPGIPESKNR
ncbi:uncharacterized protein LOC128991099 [Macrosteles quadrilineatus]|uniref:uncharacterized protein LOC128991099 n=1 Tax=Macrosteles quadrilineatus TaxID=74068 RepID=UPI0023E2041E|nr:uncharacterized protein LOC128991099 [Macrosteles quadrilineatus]